MNYRIADLFCGAGGTSEGAMEFYVSNLSICMECKRKKANAYKRRTGYNRIYRQRKEAA